MTGFSNDDDTALFVADAHFRARPDLAEERRRDRFLSLLERARGARHLVLLGDIFDFWFDYPHFQLKGYDGILRGLDAVRESGTRVHFVGGNHDIWAARYLHERYGSEADGAPLTLRLGATRIHCLHGDGILGREPLYRAFRALVRNRLAVRCAKSLHPELLFALSAWLSGTSRAANRDEAAGIEAKAERYLARCLRGGCAWDYLVIGHVHHPFRATIDGRVLLSLGGWLDGLHYARFAAGRLEHAALEDEAG